MTNSICVVSRDLARHLDEVDAHDAASEALESEKEESEKAVVALLRNYCFDDINHVFPFRGADFYTWWKDQLENGNYTEQLFDLMMRSPAWVNLHAAEISADFVEYTYSMEADK